jgi:hypothetical protein
MAAGERPSPADVAVHLADERPTWPGVAARDRPSKYPHNGDQMLQNAAAKSNTVAFCNTMPIGPKNRKT